MPEQYAIRSETFFVLSLKELRGLLAWGYDLDYSQVDHVGYSLNDGDYWSFIEDKPPLQEVGEHWKSRLIDGGEPDWDTLLEDLVHAGKIPGGNYLLSVY